MAPTKRKTEAKPSSETVQTTRVTRSSTRQETPKPAAVVAEPVVPKAKKAKVAPKVKPDSKEEEPEVVTSSMAENGNNKTVPKGKKGKATPKAKPEPKAETKEEEEPAAENGFNKKTIVVEHCKQCTQFKIRGVKVKNDLEKAVAGINVLINPEKPRRGCFEIREEGGKTFISLLDMKRPFAPMKALDMDAVISEIIEQVK